MTAYKLPVIAGALFAFVIPSSAFACDLDGKPGFGAFHRFNPFAAAMQNDYLREAQSDAAAQDTTAPQGDEASQSKTKAENAADRNRREDALKETPKREWERDYVNGAITAEDKAIFT